MVSYKSVLALLSVSLNLAAASNCSDYGSWYIEVVLRAGAQGHRQTDLYAEHSTNPGVIAHSRWFYDPETQILSFTPDDPTLNNSLVDGSGLWNLDIQQTVLGIPLKGSGPINMIFDVNGNGRGADGNTTIISELDD